jgi:hypothetical protein
MILGVEMGPVLYWPNPRSCTTTAQSPLFVGVILFRWPHPCFLSNSIIKTFSKYFTYGKVYLLRYNTMSGERQINFRRNILPPFSESRSTPRKEPEWNSQHVLLSLACLILRLRIWRRYFSPKHRLLPGHVTFCYRCENLKSKILLADYVQLLALVFACSRLLIMMQSQSQSRLCTADSHTLFSFVKFTPTLHREKVLTEN